MLRYRIARAIANSYAALRAAKRDRRAVRERILRVLLTSRPWYRLAAPRSDVMDIAVASRLLQDHAFPRALAEARRVLAVVVPERDIINGGVLSLFSIAAELRRQKPVHGYEVVIVTRPQGAPITHFRNTSLTSAENVFRFAQLRRCTCAEEMLVLLPEYCADDFVEALAPDELAFLTGLRRLRLHILNQNVDLMPAREALAGLHRLTDEVTQSVAHHAYFTRDYVELTGLPTLLLPAFTDISAYPGRTFAQKEKLVIYSPDDAPWKKDCLAAVAAALPDFELREIRGISFDTFMDLAARCMFSISFGEGFDGYTSQPMQMGGIGLAIYNDRFFPSPDLADRANLFADPADMIARVGAVMRDLAADEARYTALNAEWNATIDALYDHDDYRRRVGALALGRFELFPGGGADGRSARIEPSAPQDG